MSGLLFGMFDIDSEQNSQEPQPIMQKKIHQTVLPFKLEIILRSCPVKSMSIIFLSDSHLSAIFQMKIFSQILEKHQETLRSIRCPVRLDIKAD